VDAPVLVIADDAQWLDQASLDALTFAARRLDAERVVLLVSARGTTPPPGFERDFQQLLVEPLPLPDAGRLLDVQPRPPRGRAREQVLAQAAGNPLALIELSKMLAADPQAGRRWATELLPLSSRLTAIMAARYATLPPRVKAGLLLAAAADSDDVTVTAHAADLTMDTLAQAEAAGLIRIDASGPRFTHPLARSAVYYSAPFAERATAHRKIAGGIRDRPDRSAWHLAAAAPGPDEQVAALLEDSAAAAQRRGGVAAAARAMERAAELSPADRDKARRLLAAADLARSAGQSDWVRDLAGKVLALTPDPGLRTGARLKIGWSLLWSGQPAEALEALLSVAGASRTQPSAAWDAAAMAATIGHQTGLRDACARVLAAAGSLDHTCLTGPSDGSIPTTTADEARMWIWICADPFGRRDETVPYLHRIANGTSYDLARVGGAAWSLDETELAVRILRQALSQLDAPGVRGTSGAVLSCLEWACVDSGRWDEALGAARRAGDIAAAYKMETVAGQADLVTATVAAMRGEHGQVARLLAGVLAGTDEAVYRGFAARARHAAGLAALAQGRSDAAYAQLSRQFTADGTPLHYHFSYYAIADYAAAAARAGRHREAKTRIERALALAGPGPGPRLEQLAARARALLADPAEAGQYFTAGLADPAGETWPFERAQLQLDYGEWLRRQRRINDAKPVLAAALDTFSRIGAAPWVRRTDSELRACGVPAEAGTAGPGALDDLTPQQREIAVLASHGLTNSEIADRLFLSPRTVASHLHRAYPKLGITGRHQLRALVDQAGL
jgi:DNA-binding CsgD family transcriptional regulator